MREPILKLLSCLVLFFGLLTATALTQAANASDCVNINTAPKEELKKIIHIGEARAEQIISLRKEKPFSSVGNLDRIVGIGPSRITDIKEQGLACVGESQPEPEPKPEPGLPTLGSEPKLEPVEEELPPLTEKLTETESPEAEESHAVKPRKNAFAWWAAGLTAFFSGGVILILKKKMEMV